MMVEFFIVLSFWVNGSLIKQTSYTIPTMQECEKLLKHDLEQRIKIHGNATGVCVATPQLPEGEKPDPARYGPMNT
jgi:hypothetical protein